MNRAARHTLGRRRSAGLALVELLIVLALLAAVAAMAWPLLKRPFAGYRLRAATDTVRAQWIRTRVEAMRTGYTYAFRYVPGGDRFRIERHGEHEDAMAGKTDSGAASDDRGRHIEEQSLPEGVAFAVPGDANVPMDNARAEASLTEADWSDPILFHPDGTTSNAELSLRNDHGSTMNVCLHGLTGAVTVSEDLGDAR